MEIIINKEVKAFLERKRSTVLTVSLVSAGGG
jgi:hypothetical protein